MSVMLLSDFFGNGSLDLGAPASKTPNPFEKVPCAARTHGRYTHTHTHYSW